MIYGKSSYYKLKKNTLMKKNKKWFWLLPIGLLVISISITLNQYVLITDWSKGLWFGAGIGLLVLAFMRPRIKQQS